VSRLCAPYHSTSAAGYSVFVRDRRQVSEDIPGHLLSEFIPNIGEHDVGTLLSKQPGFSLAFSAQSHANQAQLPQERVGTAALRANE